MYAEKTHDCPLLTVHEYDFEFRLWTHYNKGFLPSKGGILDQKIRAITAIEIIEGCINKVRSEEEKRNVHK